MQFIAEGQRRVRIKRWLSQERPYLAQVEYLADDVPNYDQEVQAYALAVMGVIQELIPLNPLFGEQLKAYLNRFTPNQSSRLADFAASLINAPASELQAILESTSTRDRLHKVHELLRKDLEVAKLHTQIREEVQEKMGAQQRRFFLQEQLKVIQEELGISKDDRTADADEFMARLEHLELPPAAEKRIDEELQKFSVLETGSPEYAVTRNYLDWVTSLPWGVHSKDNLDLIKARTVLDADHTGLDDVKDRILE